MIPSYRLGSRLRAVYEVVLKAQNQTAYSRIWDCCCDHGYLGLKILQNNLCEKLIFVDQVPHIIQNLSLKLGSFCSDQYELFTVDAGELSFESHQRHLVILSGVGGECMVDIIRAIAGRQGDASIDYIFCPSASTNALRKYLNSQNFTLLSETIACEKKRYYEILLVRTKESAGELPDVSLTNTMWQADNTGHQQHLAKLSCHEGKKLLATIG
ncbi:MAG: tRNA (adenine(22)-N(1))-methyltransferase TrmK [Gammaproteobacteria bacterium]|nr:tRNA (adenine(22)-N(1))-methyltransferase TrmK [Gammaproteobacteria bacterium]